MIRSPTIAVTETVAWLLLTMLLACFAIDTLPETPPRLVWTPWHVLPFLTLLAGAYRAGWHLLPIWALTAVGLLGTAGFLPLLLPDEPERFELQMRAWSPWYFVLRTALLASALPLISVYAGLRGRRRALCTAGPCRVCGHVLAGATGWQCPRCGSYLAGASYRLNWRGPKPRWLIASAYVLGALAAWVAISFMYLRFSDRRTWEVWIGTGGARVVWGNEPGWPSYGSFGYGNRFGWRRFVPILWIYRWNIRGQRDVLLPSWPIAVPLVIWLGLKAERWRYRRRTGHCRHCGYDLTGNVSGRCPECGTNVQSGGRT